MTGAARKSRGMATQALVAAWFRGRGFPFATDAGAGRAGRDVLNLIGLACEVKARSGFSPLAWVRQAVKAAAGDLPFVVLRCNGQGPAAVADWPVLLRLADFTRLVRAAGYGDPETETASRGGQVGDGHGLVALHPGESYYTYEQVRAVRAGVPDGAA